MISTGYTDVRKMWFQPSGIPVLHWWRDLVLVPKKKIKGHPSPGNKALARVYREHQDPGLQRCLRSPNARYNFQESQSSLGGLQIG